MSVSVLQSTYVPSNSCVLTIFDTALNSRSILTLNCKNHKKIVYLVARKKEGEQVETLEGNGEGGGEGTALENSSSWSKRQEFQGNMVCWVLLSLPPWGTADVLFHHEGCLTKDFQRRSLCPVLLLDYSGCVVMYRVCAAVVVFTTASEE